MLDHTNPGLPGDEIVKRIEKALEHGGGTHTWEDMREGILTGLYQIFWNDHGAAITEIVQAPQKRYLQCWVVAGELPGVMELQEQVERHALTNSCDFMQTIGRTGWEKILPNYGWKKAATVFVHEVTGP